MFRYENKNMRPAHWRSLSDIDTQNDKPIQRVNFVANEEGED